MKNWWYYHKWYVICGAILLGIFCNLAGNALGLWKKVPDFQIAYIGKTPLTKDTVSSLEQAFASISQDFNGDGEIIVQINQYITDTQVEHAESIYYKYASELTLIGDISDCESYFFLIDDPENFQRNYQLLASPDGSCPDKTDYSVEGKVVPWQDCSLSQMDLESNCLVSGQEQNRDNQELLASLYLGRRCFYTKK